MNPEPNSSNQSPPSNPSQVNNITQIASSSSPSLNPRSCVTCRRRKVRCDKLSPCSNCTKAHIQCDFPAPGRAPRRPKNGLVARGASEREAELLKRLRRLEGVVEELSGQVEVVSGTSEDGQRASASPRNSDPGNANTEKSGIRLRMGEGTKTGRISTPVISETSKDFGRLVIDEGGKSRYVNNTFWTSLSEEVDDIHGILEDGISDESDNGSPESNPAAAIENDDHQSFILGYSSSNVNLRSLHPLPSQIPFYWQVYMENVDPIVKIMHSPTMENTIKEIKNNLDSLDKSTEALMFSLYFAVITSLTAEEVKTNFCLEKTYLINRYRFATEQALARAGFLNTSEIVTVQAFVLFLVCVRRHDDSRFVWTLTGLAIRIAQSLGLHRDGSIFGLSPFDTEMRRRLWWQVCVLDVRASEDHGTDPSILEPSYDTKLPLNIDDSMLDPQATEPPEPKTGVSEMSFCLVRYEICQVNRRLNYIPPGSSPCRTISHAMTLAEKEKIVQDCHEMMENKYLKYFKDSGPLYWVAATISRLVIAKMGLIIYHPLHNNAGIRSEISQNTLDRLLVASIEIIEYSRLLETEPSTKKWGWLFHTYVQWHAIAYLLGELCIRDYDETVRRAWIVLDNVFKDWGNTLRHSKNGMLWIPIRKLMARARRKRELDLAKLAAPKIEDGNPFLDTSTTETEEYRNLYLQNQRHSEMSRKRDWNGSSGSGRNGQGTLGQAYSNEAGNQVDFAGKGDVEITGNPNQQQQIPQQQQQQQSFQQSNLIPPSGVDFSTVPALGGSPDFDMDLDALGDMDVSWQGWDDMVREFQMEVPDEQRGPVLGGMGTWW